MKIETISHFYFTPDPPTGGQSAITDCNNIDHNANNDNLSAESN